MGWRGATESFLAARYPAAEAALVAGSSAAGLRTSTSDIDLLLFGPAEMLDGETSRAETVEHDGELFEVFAYTREGFTYWAERGIRELRPVVVQMLVDGTVIRDAPVVAELRARWAPVLRSGPAPDARSLDLRRYAVTGLLDDLRDATDPAERNFIAALLYQHLGETLLLAHGRWIASGKHLPRRLAEWDADVARRLGAALADGDAETLLVTAETQLGRIGGPLRAPFRR